MQRASALDAFLPAFARRLATAARKALLADTEAPFDYTHCASECVCVHGYLFIGALGAALRVPCMQKHMMCASRMLWQRSRLSHSRLLIHFMMRPCASLLSHFLYNRCY